MTTNQDLYAQRQDQANYYINECFNSLLAGDREMAYHKLNTFYFVMEHHGFSNSLAANYVLYALNVLEFGKRSINRRVIQQLNPILSIHNQRNSDEVREAFFKDDVNDLNTLD